MLCFVPVLHGCVWYVCCYVGKKALLQCLCSYLEEGYNNNMGLYEVPLSVSLLGLGIGTMLANFHVLGIMFLLRSVLNILMRNANPRGPMCFRCLIFSLVGPCELLFLFCFIAYWT